MTLRILYQSSSQAVLADVYDTARLAAALSGADAVVSAFNPGWADPELCSNFTRGSRSIQAATKLAGVSRLLSSIGDKADRGSGLRPVAAEP